MSEPEPFSFDPKVGAGTTVLCFALAAGFWAAGWGIDGWFVVMGAFFAVLTMVFSFAGKKR